MTSGRTAARRAAGVYEFSEAGDAYFFVNCIVWGNPCVDPVELNENMVSENGNIALYDTILEDGVERPVFAFDISRLLDADPTRIDVAYHGVDPGAFHAPTEEEKARVRARLGLGSGSYIAFLGAKEPRKNVPNLIRGWVLAVRDRPNPPALVVAGGQGHDDDIDGAVADVPGGSTQSKMRPGSVRRPKSCWGA